MLILTEQETQLSQRDRAAGCVIVFAKSRRLELGDGHYRSIFNHCDIIGLKICRIPWKKTQNKGNYGVQGHRGRYQSKAVCDLLLVINSKWHLISYCFGVIAVYCSNCIYLSSSSSSNSFRLCIPTIWSKLTQHVRSTNTREQFKRRLKGWLFECVYG